MNKQEYSNPDGLDNRDINSHLFLRNPNVQTQGLTNLFVRGRIYPNSKGEYVTPATRSPDYVYEKIPYTSLAEPQNLKSPQYLIDGLYSTPQAHKPSDFYTDSQLLGFQPTDPQPGVDTSLKRTQFLW